MAKERKRITEKKERMTTRQTTRGARRSVTGRSSIASSADGDKSVDSLVTDPDLRDKPKTGDQLNTIEEEKFDNDG